MAGFYRGIDELAGTQVDCYCYCISAGGDTYRHPSEVAPLLGADLETLDGVPDYLRREIENTRALLADGVNPLVLLPRRAREHGMAFWASMRMNDIHDDYPECAAYHGGFRKAHPELLLGSPYPEPRHRGNWRSGFCWGLDYARPEVRAATRADRGRADALRRRRLRAGLPARRVLLQGGRAACRDAADDRLCPRRSRAVRSGRRGERPAGHPGHPRGTRRRRVRERRPRRPHVGRRGSAARTPGRC